ncbi:MAG: DUF2312 domain-containing protein [Rickettsiaceae bacterium]|nr:DUF2312 domain-containing protein [Rickettsiaceae bacterium]
MTEVFARDQLIQYLQKIENMENEKQIILDQIKEIYTDAKNNGFDVKTMKHILKLRRIEKNKLAEIEALIELYRDAAGV